MPHFDHFPRPGKIDPHMVYFRRNEKYLQNRNQTDWSKAIELALTNYSIRGCYVRVCESLRNFHCQALAHSLVTFSPPNNQTCFSIIQNFRSCILSINHFVLICIAKHWRDYSVARVGDVGGGGSRPIQEIALTHQFSMEWQNGRRNLSAKYQTTTQTSLK